MSLPALTVLAERYRVVSLLGKGGMGEVYRDDGRKLGLGVALMFLPNAIATANHSRSRSRAG